MVHAQRVAPGRPVGRDADAEIVVADQPGLGPARVAALIELGEDGAGGLLVEDEAQVAGAALGGGQRR
jgi:hypothetical protein